jgi:carboxypeptidase family protein
VFSLTVLGKNTHGALKQMARAAFVLISPFRSEIGVHADYCRRYSLATNIMRRRRFFGLSLLFFPFSLMGQGTSSREGSIQGRVTDEEGLPIVRALVVLDDIMGGQSMQTATDEKGFYLLESVKPGKYSLRVEAARIGCIIIPRLVVNYGEQIRRDFRFTRSGKQDCKAS